MKQRRGCSRLVYATYTFDRALGTITFGTVKELAPVKSITRTIDEASEEVWASNELNDVAYGGKKITKSFEITRLSPEVEFDLFNLSSVVIKTTQKAYGEAPQGDRPYFAIGYAMHDGDADQPCEVVWVFKAQARSLTKTASTIKLGDTASEGQTLEIDVFPPDKAWTATGKRNLDIWAPIDGNTTFDFEDWFDQVITFDNVATILGV